MDKLSQFLIDNWNKPTSPVPAEEPELTLLEKRAYINAAVQACTDENFLAQFEGSPLAPQAIALMEQELAMKQRHLQQRMQRQAQDALMDHSKEWTECEALDLQKKQLVLELAKMKTMGVGAPTPPGQAEIGTPDPAVQAAQAAAAAPPAEAPAAEPKLAGLIGEGLEAAGEHGGAGFVRGAAGEFGAILDRARTNPAMLAALGIGGAGVGMQVHNSNQRQERMASALEQIAANKQAGFQDDAAQEYAAQRQWETMGRGERAVHHGGLGAVGGAAGGAAGALLANILMARQGNPARLGVGQMALASGVGGGLMGALSGATRESPKAGKRGLALEHVRGAARQAHAQGAEPAEKQANLASAVGGLARKARPTVAINPAEVMQYAQHSQALKGAIQAGKPVTASASMLDHLHQLPFSALKTAAKEYVKKMKSGGPVQVRAHTRKVKC